MEHIHMYKKLFNNIIKRHQSDPRNKLFLEEKLILLSIKEVLDRTITPESFRALVSRFLDGTMENDDDQLYDAGTACCDLLINMCYGEEDSLDDVGYTLTWLVDNDGSYTAVVHPMS